MVQNRIRDHAGISVPVASIVPSGFVLVSASALPAPLAEAAAAQQELYRLAYQRALESIDSARRVRRWMFRAAHAVARN